MSSTDFTSEQEPVALVKSCLIYEDNHLIIVSKPFNIPSQGDQTGDPSLFHYVKEYIRKVYQKPGQVYLALIHRLDRPAGGIMVFAKTGKAAARMSKLFKEKLVDKRYFAITVKAPEKKEGTLKHYLRKRTGKNTVQWSATPGYNFKEAILHYKVLNSKKSASLLEVSTETGRPHQIRVQLSANGTPIIGDKKYGSKQSMPDRSIALFAYSLKFEHPVRKTTVKFTAPFPDIHVWKPFSKNIRGKGHNMG